MPQLPADFNTEIAGALDAISSYYQDVFSHEFKTIINFITDTYTNKIDTVVHELYNKYNLNQMVVHEMLKKMYAHIKSSKIKNRITKILHAGNSQSLNDLQTTENLSNEQSDGYSTDNDSMILSEEDVSKV